VLPGQPTLRAFRLGLVSGVVYFAGTLYWIAQVMVVYGDVDRLTSVLINAALVAYLALFPALFAAATARLVSAAGLGALLIAPFIWVATELGRTYLLSGFPWVLLGYSQMPALAVAQLASVLGVYGVSALVASVSAALAIAVLRQGRRPRASPSVLASRLVPLVVTLAVVALVAAWGRGRLSAGALTREGELVRVGIVQGNVDQADKWNDARAADILTEHVRLTREAVGQRAELVIWPESSTPFFFEEEAARARPIRDLAREAGVAILLGSQEIDRSAAPRYYNSAFLVGPDGLTAGTYRKMHLVPFGEYVPLKRVLFFIGRLVEAVSDFSAGQSATMLNVRGHAVSSSICYEIVYPHLVRQFVEGGSELLTTITNDAWFGGTSAPYQHFAQAAMRAIENGRYLVRSANTGISGIVDPYGSVLAQSRLFEAAVIVGDVRFLDGATLYSRTGDLFAYGSVILTVIALVTTVPGRRKVQ
jgi:apolipoprotein N-acyltransferase